MFRFLFDLLIFQGTTGKIFIDLLLISCLCQKVLLLYSASMNYVHVLFICLAIGSTTGIINNVLCLYKVIRMMPYPLLSTETANDEIEMFSG